MTAVSWHVVMSLPFFVLTHQAPATVPDWMTGTFVDEGIVRCGPGRDDVKQTDAIGCAAAR